MTKGTKISEIAKKEEKPKPAEELKEIPTVVIPLDITKLTAMPTHYLTAFSKILNRLAEASTKSKQKGLSNYIDNTAEMLVELAEKVNDAYVPAPPKHLEDAYAYAKSRKYEGTYIALLDGSGQLVKVVIVAKNEVWASMPPLILAERPVTVEMTGKYLMLEGTEFGVTESNKAGGKAVSRKAVKAVPFSSNRDKVFEYKNGEIVR
jgi:hypothetical protein